MSSRHLMDCTSTPETSFGGALPNALLRHSDDASTQGTNSVGLYYQFVGEPNDVTLEGMMQRWHVIRLIQQLPEEALASVVEFVGDLIDYYQEPAPNYSNIGPQVIAGGPAREVENWRKPIPSFALDDD